MDVAPPPVVRSMTLDLIDEAGAATPLEAELRYDPSDPYAVLAVFHTSGCLVRWVFSRELLSQGLYEPVGDGDVHVWPCLDAVGRAVVIVELSSPDGEALLQARSDQVSDFLARTREVVPSGQESRYLDVDNVVFRLLSGTA
jgi:hypothetical protein